MGKIDNFGLPFTSVAGDRMYNGGDWRTYYNSLFTDGVIHGTGSDLVVAAQSVPDSTVEVGTGSALINGTLRRFENPSTLVIAANASGSVRIDRIVVRIDYAGRKMELAVRQGTPGAGAPALVRTIDLYELGLARVTLASGFSSVVQSDITDDRLDASVCGYVSPRLRDISAVRGFLDSLHLSTTPADVPTDIGSVYWDADAQTLSVVLPDGVTLQIGEEMYVVVARDSAAPNPILNGTPVYTMGESGQRPRVGVSRADDPSTIRVTGIATHDISNLGRITSFGLVRAIPLARKPVGETWAAGNYLWLSPTGGMTNVEPIAPTPNVRIGLITNVTGAASFDLLVYIRPAMGLYDLYDVNGGAPGNGDEITYDSLLGYWKKSSRITLAEQRIDNLIAQSGTSDAEVVDARLSGVTGILYDILKNRLDAMEKYITVVDDGGNPVATLQFRLSSGQPQLITEEI